MDLVKVVVQFKNDIGELKPEQYISVVQVGPPSGRNTHTSNVKSSESSLLIPFLLWPVVQSVGMALRDLIQSVDEILPTLHESVRTEVPPSFIFLSLTSSHFPLKMQC